MAHAQQLADLCKVACSLWLRIAARVSSNTSLSVLYVHQPNLCWMHGCGSQAIAAGEEVLISYLGEKPSKPNAALMKDYGFVMPGNINDTISFDIEGEYCCVMRALQPPSVFVGVTKPHHQRPYWQHCCSAQPSSSVWLQ